MFEIHSITFLSIGSGAHGCLELLFVIYSIVFQLMGSGVCGVLGTIVRKHVEVDGRIEHANAITPHHLVLERLVLAIEWISNPVMIGNAKVNGCDSQ